MAILPAFRLAPRDDDEGVFSRDVSGHLVRMDAATEKDFKNWCRLRWTGVPSSSR